MTTMTGSCNCGDSRYEVDGNPKNVVNCHCGLCRKMNGAAFSTYVVVLASEFTLLNGSLVTHRVTDRATKSLCGSCGTPIYNENPRYAGLRMLHLGSLDEPNNLAPQINIYCESQVAWLASMEHINSLNQGID